MHEYQKKFLEACTASQRAFGAFLMDQAKIGQADAASFVALRVCLNALSEIGFQGSPGDFVLSIRDGNVCLVHKDASFLSEEAVVEKALQIILETREILRSRS